LKLTPTGRWTTLLAVPLAGALLLGACGGDDDDASGSGGDSELSGEILVSGSSTVEPITSLVGESFFEENPGVDVVVEGPGTGDGFKKFCAGETDISDASRQIKDEEIALCEEAGIEYVEIPVAYDAISVITSSNNDAVECLTFEDQYGLVGPESNDVGTWADAKEITATSDLPDAPIEIFAPGEESGTFDSYVELVLEDLTAERLGEDYDGPPTRDYGGLADDNQIIAGIQSTDTSYGWVGFAFADLADVKKLEVDGGDGCVAPSAETVEDGTYPISRTLYIYVSKNKLEGNDALAAFVDFYLDNPDFVTEADYINLDEATADEARTAWDEATA
jgi:phosphate transport system substrate-binding protein